MELDFELFRRKPIMIVRHVPTFLLDRLRRYIYTPVTVLCSFGGRLFRGRCQHGLGGERQFLRHKVGYHVGSSPHVLPSLVVVVRVLNLQLKSF